MTSCFMVVAMPHNRLVKRKPILQNSRTDLMLKTSQMLEETRRKEVYVKRYETKSHVGLSLSGSSSLMGSKAVVTMVVSMVDMKREIHRLGKVVSW